MDKTTILITGTPCVGKTTVAKELAEKVKGVYINLTDYANTHHLVSRKDVKRATMIVNEKRMRAALQHEIDNAERRTIVIDGHFAAAVVPKNYVTRVFVLRRNPVELRTFMEECGFKNSKLWENLCSEILDVCLIEALREQGESKVCELDITGKTSQEVVEEISAILVGNKKCFIGSVDWIGFLEREGLTEAYLKL